MPISKLEKMFEAETLAEREQFATGSDSSMQEPALRRLKGNVAHKRREGIKVGSVRAMYTIYVYLFHPIS